MYSGRAVMGSPFYVEIYDPSRVYVEDIQTSWNVGDLIEFDGECSCFLTTFVSLSFHATSILSCTIDLTKHLV